MLQKRIAKKVESEYSIIEMALTIGTLAGYFSEALKDAINSHDWMRENAEIQTENGTVCIRILNEPKVTAIRMADQDETIRITMIYEEREGICTLEICAEESQQSMWLTLLSQSMEQPEGMLPDGRLDHWKENSIQEQNLLNGTEMVEVPVLLFWEKKKEKRPLPLEKLAKNLTGIAHVVRIQTEQTKKEFCLFVGNEKKNYPTDGFKTLAALETAVRKGLERMENIKGNFTWEQIEVYYRNASEEKRNFDNAISSEREKSREQELLLEQRIRKLEEEKEALLQENERLRNRIASNSTDTLLEQGELEELFPGELKEFVIEALQDAVRNGHETGRRKDVLESILSLPENQIEGVLKKRRELLKQALKDSVQMDFKQKKILNEIGIEIVESKKHYKLQYYRNPRYHVTLAKSTSDGRSAENCVSHIIHEMF